MTPPDPRDHGHAHASPDPRDHGHAHSGPDAHDHLHAHAHGHPHQEPGIVAGGDSHGHRHAHGRIKDERRLLVTLVMGVAYMVVEAVGGWWVGSLALMADAGHMLSDSAALALTLFALRIARLPADPRRTYGYHRAEVLAAVANAAALFAIGGWVLVEAWHRWGSAAAISGPLMLAVATGGLVVNGLGLVILHGADRSGLNVRAAWLHLVSDALGSAGAIVAGLAIWAKGWTWADPLASAFISVLVLRSAWGLLSDAVGVLMEGVPPHIDLDAVRAALEAVPGVAAVHDVHVWTITSGIVAMSGHVVACDGESHATVLNRVANVLRSSFGIWHSTIQVEPEGFEEAEMHR